MATAEEIYFEITVIGNSARVCAIHATTGQEVVVICPARLSRAMMEQAAVNKLRYVLNKPLTAGA